MLTSGTYGTLPTMILIFYLEERTLNGFLQVELRSHADGCDPAQPVQRNGIRYVIDHASSKNAHEALGFEIVDRCINFRKGL
jgi:aminoglycoside 6'-N-acetyltransferase I